ncbi:MAG: phosphoribosylformylglycinamidine synthase subunit PurS [Nitrospirae bacterium]|nr:phosphoribosylformylglycinamidine synthase subunit PurS [Nitrospirota bacterium]
MRAVITLNLKSASTEESQRILNEICEKLKADGVIDSYSFEIQSANGIVTEKCMLSEGKVIA